MKVKYRVKSHEDFQKVIHANKKLHSKSFTIYYEDNEYGHARVGISTSKKLGHAVIRNRIRRQVRSMCREIIDFNVSKEYCIIVRNNYLQQDFEKNKDELKKLILKI